MTTPFTTKDIHDLTLIIQSAKNSLEVDLVKFAERAGLPNKETANAQVYRLGMKFLNLVRPGFDERVSDDDDDDDDDDIIPFTSVNPTLIRKRSSAAKPPASKKRKRGVNDGDVAEGKIGKTRKCKATSKKAKDRNFPRRGLSAYDYFNARRRAPIKKAYPNLSFGEIATMIGAEWRALTVEGRAPYDALAAADKQRYLEEKAAYAAA